MTKVYLISATIEGITLYKIGFTKRHPQKRIKEIKTSNASDLELISIFESKWACKIESILHRMYNGKKISGEWFKLSTSEVINFTKNCEQAHRNLECISENNTLYHKKKQFVF